MFYTMSSFSIDLDMFPNETFSEIQQCIGTANYKGQEIVPNQSIISEGKRDFNWGIMIILIIFLWPAALVYYFTRQKSSISATITKNETGCNLTVTSSGESSEKVMDLIKDIFKESGLSSRES